MQGWIVFISFLGGWLGFALWARRNKKWSWTIAAGGGFIIGCLSLGLAAAIFIPNKTESPPAPVNHMSAKEQQTLAREEKIRKLFSAWDGSHNGLEKLIKETMNDPDSYKHVETVYWDMGNHLVVRTTFRGKNAFGGVVKNWVKAKISLNGEVMEIIEQGN